MELIKWQKWEKLFKRRELVNVDAVKEFYAKLTMSHNKKKEVAKSSVRGVDIEFDSERLASILGIPGNNGIFDVEEPVAEVPIVQAFPASPGDSTTQQKEPEAVGVDPSGPSGHIPESVMIKLQAEFERARANKIQADLEKA
ncbi:hypothetical protein Dimus_010249 [Dionaea muscipula]